MERCQRDRGKWYGVGLLMICCCRGWRWYFSIFRTVTSLQLVVLTVLLCGSEVTSADICRSYGSGCRAPFGLDTAYETLFSPVCHLHSICYSCVSPLFVCPFFHSICYSCVSPLFVCHFYTASVTRVLFPPFCLLFLHSICYSLVRPHFVCHFYATFVLAIFAQHLLFKC